MKKYTLILSILLSFSVPVVGQIAFVNKTSQLPTKKTTFKAVEIGDVTNDGLNDVVVGSGYLSDDLNDYGIFIYKQLPNGTLASPVKIDYPKSYPGINDLEIGDFNHDQLNDIALCYGSTLGVFYQLPNGGFSTINTVEGPYYNSGIESGDLNHDGLTDLVGYADQSYKIFLQKPTGGFTMTNLPSKALYCTKLDIKDMNGDEYDDIVKAYGTKIEVIYQKNGTTITKDSSIVFGSELGFSDLSGLTVGDLNNDGRNDLAVAYGGNSGKLVIVHQKANGMLDIANFKRLSTYDIPKPMCISDLNCDGVNELILGHNGWFKISVFERTATTDFGSYTLFPSIYDSNPFSMAVGDINNDRKPDVVTVGQNATLYTLFNKSRPLTFDNIRLEVENNPTWRDTSYEDATTFSLIPDTTHECKRNDYLRKKVHSTYSVEHYSGDSLTIRSGTLCTTYCDTIRTPFDYTKRFLVNAVTTEDVVNLDSLSSTCRSINPDSNQGSQSIQIGSNTCWQIHSDAEWLRPSATSGSGNKEITIEWEENFQTATRTGNITLSSERADSITIVVVQEAAEPDAWSPASAVILSDQVNNTAIVEVRSNSTWEIFRDEDWISFEPSAGTGDALLTVKANPNETDGERRGRIGLFCNGELTTIITVIQFQKTNKQ